MIQRVTCAYTIVCQGFVMAAAPSAVVSVKTLAGNGQPLPRQCVLLDGGAELVAVKSDDQGMATVAVPVLEGQTIIRARFYPGQPAATWPNATPGQPAPTCGVLPWERGYVLRAEYKGVINKVDNSAAITLQCVKCVSVTMHLVDTRGHALNWASGSVVGSSTAAPQSDDNTLKISGVPANEAALLVIWLNGEQFLHQLPPTERDLDIGEVQLEPAVRTAPLKLSQERGTSQFDDVVAGSMTLASVDGKRVFDFVAVEGRGLSGGPKQGEASLVAPGEYFVLPGTYMNPKTAEILLRIRRGNLAGTENLPRVTAVVNEVRPVHMVVDEADRKLRRALLAPQVNQ